MPLEFFGRLLDTSGFPPRWRCGVWTSEHGWLHIVSDLGIWSAYFTIPIILWLFAARRGRMRFRNVFLLFAAFIFLCGATHLMEAAIFWWPAYRLAGLLKFCTAVISWCTVLALFRIAPTVRRMPTHLELEAEVAARRQVENELVQLNLKLDQRVKDRVQELAEANNLLRQEREWFRTTLASIGDAVISTDSQGRITMLNDVAAELTGWKIEQAVGQPLETVFHIISESTRARVANPAERALKEQVIVGLANHTLLIARDGREYPIADSAAPIRGANSEITGAVLVFRDVTETRRLEEQYRQAQKMEAIGRFAGGIAHDFNNLLTVINGYCQLFDSDCQLTAPCRDYLNEIHRAGNRAATLTQQLLAFSRMQMALPKTIDLNEIVSSMQKMLERLIGEDVRVRTNLAEDLWLVSADRGQLEQVLVNLAVNSRDAMPEGGEITIETFNLVVSANNANEHVDAPAGEYVVMAFHDNGCGMDENVRQRAFEPYFTTKEQGKGTGLGLATVFGIVSQSQGHISLMSKPGQGALIQIYLPRSVETEPLVSSATVASQTGGHETILVVEDDEMVHNLTCQILRAAGYHVLEARNGREAEQIFSQGPEKIDLVVSDIVMPEMSGRQLRENLGAYRPDIKVLLVSGYSLIDSLGPGMEADENILPKPFSSETLLAKVRETLGDP